jgi:thiosulfate reductase cytochrome b subunit
VSTAALVFWIIALVLLAFGVVFVILGQNSERAYWVQRDPTGDARKDATTLATIARRAGHFAAGEYRAPLRITAIGVLMVYLSIAFAVVALIVTITS